MKSILLIGLGRFGRHIAEELNKLGHEVMAVDENEDRVNAVLSIVTNAQIGDSTNAEFLEALGVRNCGDQRKFSELARNHFPAEGAGRKNGRLPCGTGCAG